MVFIESHHDGLQEQCDLTKYLNPSPPSAFFQNALVPSPYGRGINFLPSLRRFKKTPEGEGARKNAFALSSFVSRKTNAIANAWDEGVGFTRL